MSNSDLGFGWERDFPDHRDLSQDHDEIKDFHQQSSAKIITGDLPSSVDQSKYCSPIVNQGPLNTCSANAAVGLIEYFENRAYGVYTLASRLFLFKAGRNLAQKTGNGGIQLRTAMKAMVVFGIPPEKYWPYDKDKVNDEPPAFCYAYAQAYQAISYYRLDRNPDGVVRLDTIKRYVASGYPSMFGFSVFNMGVHLQFPQFNGEIWFPGKNDPQNGGHAMMVVGYDDNKEIHDDTGKVVDKGALKVRNSWGMSWGQGGYGWMSYQYVTKKLATDFWSLIKSDYLQDSSFAP